MNDKKTALITGGTQGIGYEFAKLFAKNGYNLVLIARDKERLEEVKKELLATSAVEITVIDQDLSQSSAAQDTYNVLKAKNIHIDVLINNAGFGTSGAFVDKGLQDELNELQVNIVVLTALTKLFLKDMVKRGSGRILNVASTAAFSPGPFMAVYYASKAYVLSLSEALAEEVRGSGVTVSVLCPGPTETGFAKRADLLESKTFQVTMNPERVAQVGYRGLMSGRRVIVVGPMNSIMVFFTRIIPRGILLRAVRKIQEK